MRQVSFPYICQVLFLLLFETILPHYITELLWWNIKQFLLFRVFFRHPKSRLCALHLPDVLQQINWFKLHLQPRLC